MNSLGQSDTAKDPWSFLKGGGEMGELIRARDWSKTPLGGPEQWPQSLRTTLSIVLQTKFPTFLFWGPELISFYNDSFRPSLGIEGKHPSALGKPGIEVWAEIWDFIKPLIDGVLQTSEAVWMDDQLVPFYRNGKIEDIYWTFSYSPVNDESGEAVGIFVSCFETTQKILSFEQLQKGKDELEFAIEAADLSTWDYNPMTNKFTSNNRLKSWFGLNHTDEIALPLAIEAMIEGDRERVMAAIQKALQYESGGLYDIVYTIVNKKTSETRIVRAKGRAWFNDEKIAYRFNGTLQDISDQEEARLKLIGAEEKALLAIGSADLGTYEIDLITDDMTTSDRFNVIWGISHAMKRSMIADHIHPDDRAMRLKAHEESIRTGFIDYEARVIWPDRSQHWVKVKGKVLYDPQGMPITLLGVIQDITEQKNFAELLKAQVKERTQALERSNDDLLQFAHVITHDLKEPVRKVKIFSNRIEDELAENQPGKVGGYLARIQRAADRMSDMIEGVLTYSSLSSSNEETGSVDLNEILKNIQTDLELLIQQKSARIEAGTLPRIQAAPVLIHQLFYNLINNSLKFTRPNVAPVIRIACSLFKEKGKEMVEITVADNGIGFEQEHAGKIFNSFTRLVSKDSFEGTGLGLALSKKIVERHGGTISAAGTLGEGACIAIKLPLNNQHL